MQPHTVLIIDDEKLARDSIKVLLSENKDWQIVGEAGNGKDAVRSINQLKPDLIFLDIDMPLLNGFDLLKHLSHKPYIVFITAYDTYAIKAFEESALDYLLKPYTDARFNHALSRVKSKIEEHESHQKLESIALLLQEKNSQVSKAERKISIRTHDRIILLDATEILWVNASGNYVELFTEKAKYLHYESITNMEQLLIEPDYLRIHRSHIVKRDQIKSLKKHINGEYFVILKNDVKLKLSRSHRDKLDSIIQ